MAAKWFGAAVKRKEDPALLAGRGRFIDDIRLPVALHAAFVRSPHPHAMIRDVRTQAARRHPGVHLVLAFADLPEPMRRNALPLFVPSPAIKELHLPYALARDEAVYAGEPVAVAVADSRYVAEDAAALVEVDYQPLPAVSDCAAAMEPGSPPAHAGAASNIAARLPITVGDADTAFAGAAHVVRERMFIHRGGPFSIECRGVVASYDANADCYTVYVSSQGSHRIKRGLLDVLDRNDNQMHVITPDVGGGFGPKGAIYPEYPGVAACAKMLGRPVKWIEDRRENFLCTHQERDQFWDLELAADRDGKILGLRGRL
jgi:aerobic carbon-monoxide dehydrogenase large subunit